MTLVQVIEKIADATFAQDSADLDDVRASLATIKTALLES